MVRLCFFTWILVYITCQARAQPGYGGEWKKTRLYGHAFVNDGFNEEQYAWVRNHFEYFCFEKKHAYNKYDSPSHEISSRDDAAKLVAQNPRSKPIMIYSISHAYPQFFESEALAKKEHPEYFHSDGKHLNLANPDENKWYADVIDSNCENSELVGIFVDGVNWAVQNGYAEQVKSITSRINSFTLLNAFHPTKDRTKLIDGLELLVHADGIFVDSWFRRLCDNTTAAETLIEACLQVPDDKVMILNSWNDLKDIWGDGHSFSHAAYLMVAHDQTYYRWAEEGTWGENVLMVWHEDFGKEMGKPLSRAVRTGYAYERVFEHCTVNIDLEKKTSSVVWDQNNTLVNVEGLSISAPKKTLKPGKSLKLTAEFSPSTATYQGVTWSTSDNSLASIGSDGMLTANKTGMVTVTGKSSDGGFTSSLKIKIQ
ncbi:MAG: Ig-like domain-containing protein [Cyclobacteriaceae bacterium]